MTLTSKFRTTKPILISLKTHKEIIVSGNYSIAQQAANRPNLQNFLGNLQSQDKTPPANELKVIRESALRHHGVRPDLPPELLTDTATTNDHHNDTVNRGRTQLDEILLTREIQKLEDKESYYETYYDNLW